MVTLAAIVLAGQAAKPIKVELTRQPTALDWEGMKLANQMYMPSTAKLEEGLDGRITKAPAPKGKVLSGELKLGNVEDSEFLVILQTEGDWSQLFIDFNQNGDLTDDAPANWVRIEPKDVGGQASYRGTNSFKVKYAQGSKKWSSPYALNFFWSPGRTQVSYFRATALEGSFSVGGKKVAIRLLEDGNDGLFDRRFDTAADPAALRPVALYLNEVRKDPRGTFEFEGVNYLAELSPDGSRLNLVPTYKIVKAPAKPEAPRKPLLAAGTPAPDFTVETLTGSTVKLSDYKGKVVVLKFWATWCGPCKVSMPHFETLYTKAKPQGVELLAVCVSDEREAFKTWVAANQSKYTYPFFFDPAGRTEGQSISGRLFNVTGIPTVFIIDKDGKVAASVVGYSDGDRRVDQELTKLGVKDL